MKTLVIGLGNPLVSDDSVGLRVVAELKILLADRPEAAVSRPVKEVIEVLDSQS